MPVGKKLLQENRKRLYNQHIDSYCQISEMYEEMKILSKLNDFLHFVLSEVNGHNSDGVVLDIASKNIIKFAIILKLYATSSARC